MTAEGELLGSGDPQPALSAGSAGHRQGQRAAGAAPSGATPSHRKRRAIRSSDHRERRADAPVPGPGPRPEGVAESNSAVWPCPGSAGWAPRTTGPFEEALAAAVDLGGDTGTVGTVTGTSARAVDGAGAVPARRPEPLRVPLPGFGGRLPGAAGPRAPAGASAVSAASVPWPSPPGRAGG
ncbi:ADP-ribosylglycohydrolase family protein [Streptomyces termitum]|uniref:ADP-ribosylglycohydrolase family protein n=1 Tax=Streptomyces termitum TaxID=67368 RepID=UPI0037B02BEB